MADFKEVGVIPYYKNNNFYKFVIVTSRKKPSNWILPKGQPEDDISDREVAVNEAFEEAGIIGTIQGKAIKVTVNKKKGKVLYKLYPFKVSRICHRWPEQKLRNRRFIKAEKAIRELQLQPFGEALKMFLKIEV